MVQVVLAVAAVVGEGTRPIPTVVLKAAVAAVRAVLAVGSRSVRRQGRRKTHLPLVARLSRVESARNLSR